MNTIPQETPPRLKTWVASGDPWIWMTGSAVSVSLIAVIGLLVLMTIRGMGHFWPSDILYTTYQDPHGTSSIIVGEQVDSEEVTAARVRDSGYQTAPGQIYLRRDLIKVGNREAFGQDFLWVWAERMGPVTYPKELLVLERREWGNFYGTLVAVKENGRLVASGDAAWEEVQHRIERAHSLFATIHTIEKDEIGSINYAIDRLRLKERRLVLEGQLTPEAMAALKADRTSYDAKYAVVQKRLSELYADIRRDSITMRMSTGQEQEIPLSKVVRAYRPNTMGFGEKIAFYCSKFWEFVADEPRESNTEGGIFPAIFGTVMMVIVMSILVMPFGVVAAVYLREYAKQGVVTRLVRIAVNNLAGVPSVVYGVFGLGFFVYFLGVRIDQLFFAEALPAPTFGTPGLLWSSIVLALLTLPVVIVATEEGLTRIPRSIREGSLALGATQAETLWRVVLPMAAPGIMTGLILSVARAAGEVAPLMMVGVVKLAPSLPLDSNFPFLHLDRKFMHMGFHIYDVGFQSPNVEAARPLVYATALLLVVVVVVLNLAAIYFRNRLRERYRGAE